MSKNKSELLAKGGTLLTQDMVNNDIAMTVFMELNKTDQYILRKLRGVKASTNLKFVVAAGVVCYLYSALNERVRALEIAK